ncbi:MAG: methylenetetrahydrofolate--tRNA-(uracil(54)-C(5))-methyltransferase (FADH(2)-oxidizing) TrmFO [Coriobacteriia bacterium]|nr:methylenetetrahydrofolate--tRNA-(uracil(54)-C(5))-methyltransferase (FADH(2)-oxidizing) TrmFO [Coriobacteriia bacterium]
MGCNICIVGAGLAGSECALQLAGRGYAVTLFEMRPAVATPVHRSALCAELVCSNSLKSTKPASAAGMLKQELQALGSYVYEVALRCAVPAGGALAVNREDFAAGVTQLVCDHPGISLVRQEVTDVAALLEAYDAVVLATGPLTSNALAASLQRFTGADYLAFFDAAAPIVMADSLDREKVFRQSRYEEGQGDYLNAPFSKEEYQAFIEALLDAQRVIAKDFESKDLFQACQPIEEIARSGFDAPRFGPLKPVGLTDPRTGRRPWAALQLRAEDAYEQSYNLVGFQTNLTFPEQQRVFRLIPGLEQAEFARYGVMHRNTFIDAPRLLDASLRLTSAEAAAYRAPLFVAGQLSGTEGYVEAIRSGLHAALGVQAFCQGVAAPQLPVECAFGALVAYATNPETLNYQPSHVNFGILPPLDPPVRNKQQRYALYAERGQAALRAYCEQLRDAGLLAGEAHA